MIKAFNHAILEQVQDLLEKKGQTYELIDLYEDGFNPVYTKEELALFNKGQALDPLVLKYQEALASCDRLIMIFLSGGRICQLLSRALKIRFF